MGEFVASEVIKCMIKKDIQIKDSKILIMGITFKENCPDVRNTKVIDVVSSLKSYGSKITIYDPLANEEEVMNEYGLVSIKVLPKFKFDAVVLSVAHSNFKEIDFSKITNAKSIVYDVKNFLDRSIYDKTL